MTTDFRCPRCGVAADGHDRALCVAIGERLRAVTLHARAVGVPVDRVARVAGYAASEVPPDVFVAAMCAMVDAWATAYRDAS